MENREQTGQILKQTRESKGLSLRTVHESTKIPMDILRALEEGYTVRTLTPFYYKGFVKIYAQFLGIELNAIMDDYQPEKLPEHIKGTQRSLLEGEANYLLKRERIRIIAKICIGVLLFFGLLKVFGVVSNKIKKKESSISGSRQIDSAEKSQKSSLKSVASQTKEKKASRGSTRHQTPGEQKTSQSLVSEKATRKQKEVKNINLTVRAKSNSWLRVRADDVVVFQSTLKRGIVETWIANEKLEISGRNINRLEFEFNGKLIGSLGRESRQIRKVVFTKDGLSVQK